MSVTPIRRKLRTAHRLASRALSRVRAAVVDTRIGDADLAKALGVPPADLDAAVTKIRRQLAGRLPVGAADISRIGAALAAHAPDETRALSAAAEQSLVGRFDLLGSGPITFGSKIDWHADARSGYRWNATAHYSAISLTGPAGTDVKWPWELSRGQHLPRLAQAALITGRPEFGARAIADIADWIDANPPEYGVNWTSAMEAAIRAVNWLWAVSLLADHPALTDDQFRRVLASLIAHGRFIAANLEDPSDGIRTNHYIAGLVGLLYIALLLPENAASAEWRAAAETGLRDEMRSQVLPDGVSYESSIAYHRLVTEMFFSAAFLARHHGRPCDAAFDARLRAMAAFVAAYTKPNGLAPQHGDTDDGRLHVLSGYGIAPASDHRHILALASHYFAEPAWQTAAGPRWTEALWFGGMRQPETTMPPQSAESAAFRDAGIFVLRHGGDHVLFTAGAVGTRGLGNHKHNDVLSFEAFLDGEDVIVDPGTFEYGRDPQARQAFRSTRAHSTVAVDDAEQNRFVESIFGLTADARPKLVDWQGSSSGAAVEAEHDGYCRRPIAVTHRRRLSLGGGHQIRINDLLLPAKSGDRPHRASWALTFAPGCEVAPAPGGWHVTTAKGRRFVVTSPVDAASARPIEMATVIEPAWVSPSFGVRESSQVLRWVWRGSLPLAVAFEIRPAA